MGPVIDCDDETTWPSGARQLLVQHTDELVNFRREEHRINLADFKTRWQATNPYRAVHEEVTAALDHLIARCSVVGYHCTRLHNEEVDAILTTGVVPLDARRTEARIQRRIDAGDLARDVGAHLLRHHRADDRRQDDKRTGMSWFVFTKASLSNDPHGLWRFFAYWGGEAIYVGGERDPRLERALRDVGRPCIVEVCLAVDSIECFTTVGTRLMNCFLARRGVETNPEADWEGFTREPIAPERIRHMHVEHGGVFERLVPWWPHA